MSVEVTRTNNTAIYVQTQSTGNRVTVDHWLWFARELQEAINAGLPTDTEVVVRNETGVNGVTITARGVLVQDIP